MLTPKEINFVYQRAYLPEHLLDYVESISGAEAYFCYEHLCFVKGKHLIFVGYPLGDKCNTKQAYESICHQFQPDTITILAPQLWFPPSICENLQEDFYYRLVLPVHHLPPKIANMVRRAAREVKIVEGKFGKEHKQLVAEFLLEHKITEEQKITFERIPQYLARSKTARVLEARRMDDVLVAFNIVDLGSADYAFHLFHIHSKEKIPGVSDLLFYKMVSLVQEEGKKFLNMGLGINPGIRWFKEKWGGVPFLPYISCLIRRYQPQMEALFDRL